MPYTLYSLVSLGGCNGRFDCGKKYQEVSWAAQKEEQQGQKEEEILEENLMPDQGSKPPENVEDDSDIRDSWTEDAMMQETNLAIEGALREEMKKQ